VEGSPEEGHSVHVLDFDNGYRIITHVFWVNPRHVRE
jgi:hypothetical protein